MGQPIVRSAVLQDVSDDQLEACHSFLTRRGYARRSAQSQVFTRGSLFGSMTSFIPRKWKSWISVERDASGKVEIALNVNTTGQTLTVTETEFWDAEFDDVVRSFSGSALARVDSVEAALARNAPRTIGMIVGYSVAGAALGLIAPIAFGMEPNPIHAGSMAGVGAAMGALRRKREIETEKGNASNRDG